jgi:Tol biopolymer transport system component
VGGAALVIIVGLAVGLGGIGGGSQGAAVTGAGTLAPSVGAPLTTDFPATELAVVPPPGTANPAVPTTVAATPIVGATPFGGGRGPILFAGERSGGDLDIFSMNEIGGGVLNLTNFPAARDESPTWSPDGKRFAFVSSRDGNKEIYALNADSSGLIDLTNNRGDDTAPAWSPDGSKMAFISDRDGNPDVFVMDMSTLEAVNLTQSSFQDDHPTWSPDGAQIAFDSQRGGNKDIFIMNANGKGLINLTNNGSDDVSPAWSPTGQYIAFASFRSQNWEIFLTDLSAKVKQLTNNHSDDLNPTWSPDGTRIVFTSNRGGDAQLWMMDLNGQNLLQITNGFKSANGASWLK